MKFVRPSAALALALISAMVFGSAAQAATTLTVVTSGTSTAATSIAAGDNLDVTNDAPIPGVGVSNAEISSLWSKQSLQVKPASSLTYPEGWSLEYTTDGTNWSSTPPNPISLAVGVRTKGSVESTGPNAFKTHPSSSLIQSQRSFTGGTGGDGYDLTFAGDRVFNQFHHDANLEVQCHIQATGSVCNGITVAGYQTPNGASSFYNPVTKKMYAVVMETTSHDFGFMCIDLTTIATPALCGANAAASFVNLYNGNGVADSYREYIGSSSFDAAHNKVWTFNGANDSLMCLNLTTGLSCGTPDNGQLLPNTGKVMIGGTPPNGVANSGRVSAIDGFVYYVTDSKFGCYNPATHALCSSTGVTVAVANQYPPFPIRDASGTVTGACLYVTKICLSNTEAVVSMPANLLTFINAHTIPAWNTFNAGQWAELNNRIYLNKGPDIDASNDVYCFDFTTAADCVGFSGANVGTQIYAITTDPNVPDCLWTNGNAGQITTFNGTTGLAGCAVGSPVARMPYSAVTPRMSCSEAGRVTQWTAIHFGVPTGITVGSGGNLRVTLYDLTSGTETAISGFTNIPVDSSGNIDLTPLNTAGGTAVKRATIELTAGAVSGALLSSVTADVQYQADAPQLCLTLLAKATCANFVPANGDTSVPDGIIQVASVMTPTSGSPITESHTQTLTGTNAGTLCAAALPSPPVQTPPVTPHVPVPSLSVSKSQTSADPSYPGDLVTYSITAKNDGETDLSGVSISDPGTTLKDCSPALPVAKLLVGQVIRCTAVRAVTLADVLSGSISNTATAASESGTQAISNTVITKFKNVPGLTVVKKQISAAPKQVGDLVRYSIVATNTGNTILSNVKILDSNADLDFCSPSVPVAQLKPGASITCGATHKVTTADLAAGQIVNVAVAKSDDLTASSSTSTSTEAPSVNSAGQIDSNQVVTKFFGAGSKPTSATAGSTRPVTAGVKGHKPSGNLAFTGSSQNLGGLFGLLMLAAGVVLISVRRSKRLGSKN